MVPKKKENYREMQKASTEKILKTAFMLFAQRGYSQTSVANIAKEAGISKGLIYYYFKSKNEILEAVFNRMKREGDILFEGTERLSPKQFLNRLIALSFAYIEQQTNTFKLMIALGLQPDIADKLKLMNEVYKKEWLATMERTFEALNYDNPRAEAFLLASILDGIGLGYIVLGTDYPIREVQQLIEEKYELNSK